MVVMPPVAQVLSLLPSNKIIKNLCTNKKTMRGSLSFIIFLSAFLLCLFIFSQTSFAANSAYIQIFINETKNSNGSISFALNSVTPLFGDYNTSVKVYNSANPIASTDSTQYLLNVYLKSATKAATVYILPSARFPLYDGVDSSGNPTGQVVEQISGIMNVIVPYNTAQPTTTIGIVSGGKETKLTIPSVVIPTCVSINQTGKYTNTTVNCCQGLVLIPQSDNASFICISCGDGICSSPYEDNNICPADCVTPAKLTMLAPASTDRWTAGNKDYIKWIETGLTTLNKVNILATNISTSVSTIIATNVPAIASVTQGNYLWTTPTSFTPGSYTITVTNVNDSNTYAVSSTFQIVGRSSATAALSGFFGSFDNKYIFITAYVVDIMAVVIALVIFTVGIVKNKKEKK